MPENSECKVCYTVVSSVKCLHLSYGVKKTSVKGTTYRLPKQTFFSVCTPPPIHLFFISDAITEHVFLTLPCLYIVDLALYCRFRFDLVRGRDVHRYDTRGGDNYRMQHHRTLASEQLPSQAGVR
ncbi:hypothetical protein J6590_089393 [Homalodisca vitripennis]|nr:hypothetical protein J6590_089393 [Homalodisca vitripennis]